MKVFVKNKVVLVTGGAGFIGSNLVESFLSCDNKVICLDNLSTGHYRNIEEFENNPNFKFIEGDIRDLETCQNAAQGVDYIFHQAALGSVPRSIDNPIRTNENNINGFLNMLIAARDQKVKRFIFAASSSTYGDSKTLPKKEENIGMPLSPYAVTKYVNELYAHVFKLNYGLETIGLRYFNVFGKKQDPNGAYAAVIPKFIQLLLQEKAPTINGDGSYSRDFTYIDNVLQMNHLAATTSKTEAIGEIFNTAYGEQTSLLQLVEEIKSGISEINPNVKTIKAIHGPERQGDVPHSLADISKAKNLLEFEPTVSLKEGIEKTVQWFHENKE